MAYSPREIADLSASVSEARSSAPLPSSFYTECTIVWPLTTRAGAELGSVLGVGLQVREDSKIDVALLKSLLGFHSGA